MPPHGAADIHNLKLPAVGNAGGALARIVARLQKAGVGAVGGRDPEVAAGSVVDDLKLLGGRPKRQRPKELDAEKVVNDNLRRFVSEQSGAGPVAPGTAGKYEPAFNGAWDANRHGCGGVHEALERNPKKQLG